MVWVVSRRFYVEIRRIFSLNALPAVLFVVYRRDRLHLQPIDFQAIRMLSDSCLIMYAPAVSLQGQSIVFKKKSIYCPNPIGKYKLVYNARLVHKGSVEHP